MAAAATATATAMVQDDDDQKVATVDDPRIQTIMDRCEDLDMPSSVVDNIEQWISAGVHSNDWRRFIATLAADLSQLSATTQPELTVASPATFQIQLNAILASLLFPAMSAGPYALVNADACADVTDFLLSEVQAARMLLSAQPAQPAQPSAATAGGKQSELQSELVKLAATLHQPIKPNTPAAQLFSSLSTAITTLSITHPSLTSPPLLSPSNYTPAQLAPLTQLTTELTSQLQQRLTRLHTRHTATLHSLAPHSSALDVLTPSTTDSSMHVWQAFGVVSAMVSSEAAGGGVVEERVRGRAGGGSGGGSRHGEKGLEGVTDRGGRMDGGGRGGGGGGGGGGGRRGRGGKRGSGKDSMDADDDYAPHVGSADAAVEPDEDADEKESTAAAAPAASGQRKIRNRGKRHKPKKTVQEMQEQAEDDTMEK